MIITLVGQTTLNQDLKNIQKGKLLPPNTEDLWN